MPHALVSSRSPSATFQKPPLVGRRALPIELGGNQCFTPHVLGPAAVPRITDPAAAREDPELAVFSAMAHGRDEPHASVQIALAAIAGCVDLDAERITLYVDLVLSSISEAARRALQIMKPANYEFQSEFARHYFSRGKAEGKAEGKSEGIAEGKAEFLIKLANLKFGPLSEAVQQRIRAATAGELDQMAERLFAAETLDAVLTRDLRS